MLPSANDVHTAEDYWSLPDGVRAELIDGRLYDMIPPSPIHQLLVTGMATDFTVHIRRHGGACLYDGDELRDGHLHCRMVTLRCLDR